MSEDKTPVVIVPYETTRTEYVTKDVHIHRAPTDESVKLLREMEEKAKAEVLGSVRLDGNQFKCVVHYEREAMSMDLVVRALFELNGKRMQAEVRVPDHADPSTGLPKIRDKVAEVISTEMLASVFAAAGLPRR
jgi:hypothetical protein